MTAPVSPKNTTQNLLEDLFSSTRLDGWWVKIPTWLRRYSATLSDAWANGSYLTAWPQVAMLLSLVALVLGGLLGATHWSPSTIGGGTVIAFAQILPLLFVAVAISGLSANSGLMLVIGYALGDFFVAGPKFPANGLSPLAQLLLLRIPQILSYLLFGMLAVLPTLSTERLVGSLKRFADRSDFVSVTVTIVISAAVQGALVYAWTLATPMIIRPQWSWAGASPPITVDDFQKATIPLVPLIAIFAALARGCLKFLVRRDNAVNARIRQQDAMQQELSFLQRKPLWVRAIWTASLVTLTLSGMIATVPRGVVMLVVITTLLIGRLVFFPQVPLWRQWTDLAQRVPALFRWTIAMVICYALTKLVLAAPGQKVAMNGATGAFQAELVSECLGLLIIILLLPEGPTVDRSKEVQKAVDKLLPKTDGHLSVSAILGTVLVVALVSPKAFALCLDPVCCFGNDLVATIVVAAIIALVSLLLLPLLLPATVEAEIVAAEALELEASATEATIEETTAETEADSLELKFSNETKIRAQMVDRGWTDEQIREALRTEGLPASGKLSPATRYINPTTGRSVVVDNNTGEIFHVGDDGYAY